jgi:oligopeptidase B
MIKQRISPPLAAVKPVKLHAHNDERVDNYFWLRERTDADVIAYLEAENGYTQSIMADTAQLQEALFNEMRSRIKETDTTAPVQDERYFYYERTEVGKQYKIYCRKHNSMDAAEEILLDLNELAQGHNYLSMANFAVSPDHKLLAYALDTDGSEVYTLRVKDLESGELLPDLVPNTYYGLEWGNDNHTLYYTTLDHAKRPDKFWCHILGTDPASDVLLFHEENEIYEVMLTKSKSRRYLFVLSYGHTATEVYFLDADQPDAGPQLIEPRRPNHEYSVHHHEDDEGTERFFILTNWDAKNFRVMTAPVTAPRQENWTEFIAHRPKVKIDDIEAFRGHLVLHEREDGLRNIRVHNLRTGDGHRISFNDPVYTYSRGKNPNYDSGFVRYVYASPVQPPTVYDYSMDGRYQLLRKEQEVPGYRAADYVAERLWATAPDGVRVPISLVHRRDLTLDGSTPMLLRGYGSYGFSNDPGFDSNRVALLNRGFVVATAHIRGGGDMGREWYENGKFLHKKNTFTDFIACAEHLIAEGYTRPDRLVISGRSAGGLLMGAVTNLRPDLFAGVIAGVPFMDVISTMLDPTIPLTVQEYEEWGNPNDPVYYEYMKSYSPYDNLEAKAYPAILATAGLNDPRVQYWEPAKWVAKLRTLKTDNNLLLLKTDMGVGHSGPSGRYDYLKETAFEYAFIFKVLGMG